MTTVAWFGRRWDAPMFDDAREVPVPFGAECLGCGELIEEDDAGITMPYVTAEDVESAAFHTECHLRSILGGVEHQQQRCSCFGGTEHDDFSRAGAKALVQWMVDSHRGRWTS